MAKKARFSARVKKIYRDSDIAMGPVVANLLPEIDNIDVILAALWETITESDELFENYKNNGGGVNVVPVAALKEYRGWQRVHTDKCKAVQQIIQKELGLSLEE